MEKEKTADMKLIKEEQLNPYYNPSLARNGGGYDQPHYVYSGTIAGQETVVDISDMSRGDFGDNWVVEVKSNGKGMGCSVDTTRDKPEEFCLGLQAFSKEYRHEVADWLSKELPGYGKDFTRIMEAKEKENEKVVVLDVKTTGDKADDEVLQVTMVNANGDKLFDQTFEPEHKKTWEKTEDNSLTPSDVKGKPSLTEYKDSMEKILKSAKYVTGYALAQDVKLLEKSGVQMPLEEKYIDVREAYMEVWGNFKEAQKPKSQSLQNCVKYLHASEKLKDAEPVMAIKHCFNEMSDVGYITKWNAQTPEKLRGYAEKEVQKTRKASGKEKQRKGIHRQPRPCARDLSR